jgi:hypothetical protein
MTSADGVARDKGDDDLGYRPDEALEIEYIEPGYTVFSKIASGLVAADALIPSGAEGILTVGLRVGAPEKDNTNRRVVTGVGEGLDHLRDRVGGESVAPVGSVEGHPGNAVALLVDDVRVFPEGLPAVAHRASEHESPWKASQAPPRLNNPRASLV